jgi:hypothetical protein
MGRQHDLCMLLLGLRTIRKCQRHVYLCRYIATYYYLFSKENVDIYGFRQRVGFRVGCAEV